MNGTIERKIILLRYLGILCIAATLLSCAHSSDTYTPDGRKGYMVDCSGSALNWGMCYSKAGELCGTRGYDTLEKDGEKDGEMVSASSAGVFGVPINSRSMMIVCKRAP